MTDKEKMEAMKAEYLTQSSSSISNSKQKQDQVRAVIQQVLNDLAESYTILDEDPNKNNAMLFTDESPIPDIFNNANSTHEILAVEQQSFRQAADVIVTLLMRYKI